MGGRKPTASAEPRYRLPPLHPCRRIAPSILGSRCAGTHRPALATRRARRPSRAGSASVAGHRRAQDQVAPAHCPTVGEPNKELLPMSRAEPGSRQNSGVGRSRFAAAVACANVFALEWASCRWRRAHGGRCSTGWAEGGARDAGGVKCRCKGADSESGCDGFQTFPVVVRTTSWVAFATRCSPTFNWPASRNQPAPLTSTWRSGSSSTTGGLPRRWGSRTFGSSCSSSRRTVGRRRRFGSTSPRWRSCLG